LRAHFVSSPVDRTERSTKPKSTGGTRDPAGTAQERAECEKMRDYWIEIANSWQFVSRKER